MKWEDISSPVRDSYPPCTGRVLFTNDTYFEFRSADYFTVYSDFCISQPHYNDGDICC